MALYKRILQSGLCPSDLNREIQVLKRESRATSFGSSSVDISFSLIGKFMCAVETINGVTRMYRKNKEDTSTHLFFFQYSSRLRRLESHITFIKMRDEYYRIESVENLNEQDRVIIIEATLRGNEAEGESKA